MRRLAGQAARGTARLIHVAVRVALAALLLAAIAAGGLAWRLSHGQLDVTWLARRIAERAETPRQRIGIGHAALTWEGWRLGLDHPLDLRLADVTVRGPQGRLLAEVPAAELSVSFAALLIGRIRPRALALDAARLTLSRGPDGAVSLGLAMPAAADAPAAAASSEDTASLDDLLAALMRPPRGDLHPGLGERPEDVWSQLRRIEVHDAAITVRDAQLGATWNGRAGAIDLVRGPEGGIVGSAAIDLTLGGQGTTLTLAAHPEPGGEAIRIAFTPLDPARLADAVTAPVPGFATPLLRALDAPLAGSLALSIGPHFLLRDAAVSGTLGAGRLVLGQTALAVRGGALDATGDLRAATLRLLRLDLASPSGQAGPVLKATGRARRGDDGGHTAALTLDLDRLTLADLPYYWPPGLAHNARDWVTQNVTAGIAHDGHVDAALAEHDGNIALTGLSGGIAAGDVSVYWLRPVPPVEHATARLTLDGPDALTITATNGRQAEVGNAPSSLLIGNARMHIVGLSVKDQFSDIALDATGSVPDLLALLRHKRLHLLSAHPIALRDPQGQVAAHMTVKLPLETKLTVDEIAIHATGEIGDAHLAAVVAGRDLDHGTLGFDVTNDGLKVDGTGRLAAVPATLSAALDFRNGGPSQVTERYAASGEATAAQLAASGIDLTDELTGSVAVQESVAKKRNGVGDLALHLGLDHAALRLAPLGWHKPEGSAASLDLAASLRHDSVAAIDRISAEGSGLAVQGSGRFAAGRLAELRLSRLVLGGTDASGDIVFPADAPLHITLAGPSLDLSGRFGRHAPAATTPKPKETAGSPVVADLRFARVALGAGRSAADLVTHAEIVSDRLRRLTLTAVTTAQDGAGHGDVTLSVTPDAGGRALTVRASDAGAVLRALDIFGTLQGGTLAVDARYDDTKSDSPLAGTAKIEAFRLRGAPFAAKLLRAVTLYGLVDVLRGQGIGFTRLVAPFRLVGDTLSLEDARAYSPALGFTAHGEIDFATDRLALHGTVVPAYFFNTLPGRLPLIGQLFSPERDGGLFAATYALQGPLDDPSVSVNPLAALTPGFLRGLFGGP